MTFTRIGLVAGDANPQVIESLRRVSDYLKARGLEVLAESRTADMLGAGQSVDLKTLGKQCDLVIAVGGDGNILNTARVMAPVPLLGINRGRLGFLADISPDEIDLRLGEVLDGDYTTEEHFLLEGEVAGQTEIPCALNEVLVHSANMPKMIEMDLYADDVFVYNQHSDGLIVSSPTGSTAYALSAGGPIMHPSLDAISLVPMFPHALTSRPLVMPGDTEIKIVIASAPPETQGVKAKVSFDSHLEFQIEPGEAIVIRKKRERLTLVHPPGHSFFGICRSKLDWASNSIRQE